jgi:hypothetical protein
MYSASVTFQRRGLKAFAPDPGACPLMRMHADACQAQNAMLPFPLPSLFLKTAKL